MLVDASMAYLNVRDRRLEAKIAYVGALHSGRGTNFERLGGARVIEDDQLAVYWQPSAEVTFRDCSVRAELVSARGETSADRLRGLLRSADGVVFVADADPTARTRTREVLACLREVLAEIAHPVPVVVQVNKTDLAEPTVVLDELSLTEWPHVAANALEGRGVAETVERTMALVLEALGRRDLTTDPTSAPTPEHGNPLLNALRQVLRETVAWHVEEVEKRNQARFDRFFAELAQQRDEIARVRASIAGFKETLTALGDTAEGISFESIRQGRVVNDLAEADGARGKQLVELARTLDGLTKADREQQSVIAGLKRSLDALPAEIRGVDARSAVLAMKVDVEKAGERVGARVTERIAQSEARSEQIEQALVAIDARTTALGAQLEALIEELKKPKKSWFG